MDDYEKILMVASGFRIAALLPYLKQLIHGYNAHEVCARRIYLVWQVRNIGKLCAIIFFRTKRSDKPDVTIAAQSLLNGALNEDTLDDGWVSINDLQDFCRSLTIENRFLLSQSTANLMISLKHFPLENVPRSIQARLHCEIFSRQKLKESI